MYDTTREYALDERITPVDDALAHDQHCLQNQAAGRADACASVALLDQNDLERATQHSVLMYSESMTEPDRSYWLGRSVVLQSVIRARRSRRAEATATLVRQRSNARRAIASERALARLNGETS